MSMSDPSLSFNEYFLLKSISRNPNCNIESTTSLRRLEKYNLVCNTNFFADPCSHENPAPKYKVTEKGEMALRFWLKDKIRFSLPLLLSFLAIIISLIALWRSW